ncbi:MAG TPA: DUF3524 domain-containing protein [Crenotrichaceae bacterium]|nr:DUF3524 domain-containing protein [Crenotrichaceae bacterium]
MIIMKVLLLSAYDVTSHRYWRKGMVDHLPSIDWQQLSLPARHFNWRIRGNPLSWASSEHERLSADYDAILATSMVDLATLKGLVAKLSATPAIVYFHENQFAYPPGLQHNRIEPQMVTLYSGLAAQQLVFNSAYNRSTYLGGVKQLLAKMPDCVPKGIVNQLSDKSIIIPVPIQRSKQPGQIQLTKPFTLVWNHRWEYDKAPERLYAALTRLKARGIEFRIHVIGQQFRQSPEVFTQIKNQFDKNIGVFGFIEDRKDYLQVLSESHLVISTAIHEFQGLAVMEAVAHGCIPVVPNRLSYPEFFEQQYCYPSEMDNPDLEATGLCDKIEYWLRYFQDGHSPPLPDMTSLSWNHLTSRYNALLKHTVADFTLGQTRA